MARPKKNTKDFIRDDVKALACQWFKPYTPQESYKDLIGYALRRLGGGINNVEITDEQILDRLTDAIQMFREYHSDSVKRTWLAIRVTKNDCDNGYITLPSTVMEVLTILSRNNLSGMPQIDYLDSPEWLVSQAWWGNLGGNVNVTPTMFGSGAIGLGNGIVSYELSFQALRTLELETTPVVDFTYRTKSCQLYLSGKYQHFFRPGCPLAMECTTIIDPGKDTWIFENFWLKSYFTCLLKLQLYTNLSKYTNVQMVGGVQINQDFYREAIEEKEKLETQLKNEFMEPPVFYFA